MKIPKLLGLLIFVSCGSKPAERTTAFERVLPDTSKTWAGQMTRKTFNQVKSLEKKFALPKLTNGIGTQELRVWNLSDSYDPQVLFVLRQYGADQWKLRTLSFYHTKGDTVYADYTRTLRPSSVDSLDINRLWRLPSQSEIKAGDKYGCVDGNDFFIEIANAAKYRFMWYHCPGINKGKDPAFLFASELASRLDWLAVEH